MRYPIDPSRPNQYEPTTEDAIYKHLADWLRWTYPDLVWFFDLSGVRVHPGTRAKIRHMRCAPGIPDLIIMQPNGGWAGMALEIKKIGSSPFTKKGELKRDHHLEDQQSMLNRIERAGYYATFGTGLQECKRIIKAYLTEIKPEQ